MAIYPTTPSPRYQSVHGKSLPAIRTESEGNYGMTRKRTTRSRSHFSLKYDAITRDEYAILEAFFLENQGTMFSYTYPLEPLKTYTVMFDIDKIEATDINPNRCNTSVELIEI